MTSQFSPKVSEILSYSREEATRLACSWVGPEHLLMGILRDRANEVHALFERMHIDIQTVKEELESIARTNEYGHPVNTRELVLNDKASNILKLAVLEARLQRTSTVDVRHLLLAILHDQVDNGAKKVLEDNNMNYEDALTYFQQMANQPQDGLGIPDDTEDDDDGHTDPQASGQDPCARQLLDRPDQGRF